jgi:hypothetical protein
VARPETVETVYDPPCHSCMVQGTKQGQGSSKNPERMDIREQMLGETGRRQWNKDQRLKEAAMSEE